MIEGHGSFACGLNFSFKKCKHYKERCIVKKGFGRFTMDELKK